MQMHSQAKPWLMFAPAIAAGSAWAAYKVGRSRERRNAARLHRILVEVLLNALSAGDPITGRHSRRVADLTDVLAEGRGLSRRERATLRVAALLHDMGKIDDRFFHIVHSRDPLSDRERSRIESHPHESAYILEPLEDTHPGISSVVASHHECWNGTGYPEGRAGEEIPLAARFISMADVFDAMTQPRAYREPLEPEEALGILCEDSGTKFDPATVALLEQPGLRQRWLDIARDGRVVEERAQKGAHLSSGRPER